jgi:hypothetical protein
VTLCPKCGRPGGVPLMLTISPCDACLNPAPKPPQEPTPYFEDGFTGGFGGPFILNNAVPVHSPGLPGSRNWAKIMSAAGRKLEARVVPLPAFAGSTAYATGAWHAVGDPSDPSWDDCYPYTSEWRIAP